MKSWLQKRKKIRKLSIILLSMRRLSAKSLAETVGLLKQCDQLYNQLTEIIRNVVIWKLCKGKGTYLSLFTKVMRQQTNDDHFMTCFHSLKLNIVYSAWKLSFVKITSHSILMNF